jgi:hypothetical protein
VAKVEISDKHRALFEGVGLSAIRHELVIGSVYYLGLENDPLREQAREWVAEQEAKLEKEKSDALALAAHRFKLILGWTIVGVVVACAAAAAAAIAAWPVIWQWLD